MSRLPTAYRVAANAAILWLVIQTGAHVVITVYHRARPQPGYAQLSDQAWSNYAHMTPADVLELWQETEALRFRYMPIVGLVQDAISSRFVNIDAHGVRANGARGNPIDGATWFFGGSTTLGWGVADHETIPAQLESLLSRPVINFGVRAHFSTTENRLLRHYLRLGYRPAAVVFLDGINESCETDIYEDDLGELVTLSQQGYRWDIGRPVVYLAYTIAWRIRHAAGWEKDQPLAAELRCRTAGLDHSLADIHARVLAERASLCALYDIRCDTFIQPFAGLHGRHDEPGFRDTPDAQYFRLLFTHLEPTWRKASATFVTDALDDLDRHAYVDASHYGAAANRHIAAAIGRTLSGAATIAAGAGAPRQ
jgi:hypothetical protein